MRVSDSSGARATRANLEFFVAGISCKKANSIEQKDTGHLLLALFLLDSSRDASL